MSKKIIWKIVNVVYETRNSWNYNSKYSEIFTQHSQDDVLKLISEIAQKYWWWQNCSNFRSTCYKYDKIRYNMRNCADINMLINQEIIHWDDIDYFAWDREDTHDILIWLMHDLLWKNDIVKQVKN